MNRTKFTLEPYDNDSLGILCGNLDENIRAIENYFNVEIKHRADEFEIESNSSANNTQARRFVKSCYAEIIGGSSHLDLEEISTILNATAKEQTKEAPRPQTSSESEVQLRSKKT